jgi:DNA-binding sugar fermentation-stimulating protein
MQLLYSIEDTNECVGIVDYVKDSVTNDDSVTNENKKPFENGTNVVDEHIIPPQSTLREATIVKRPSSSIKSPYVADIFYFSKEENCEYEALAHTPSLGCCGLCEKNCNVIVAKSSNPSSKCEFVIYLSIIPHPSSPALSTIVGTHPRLAEKCVETGLKNGLFSWMYGKVQKMKSQCTIKIEGEVDSRFDFSGVDGNNVPFILEVKSVPLAIQNTDGTKIAYFPDGYRKKKGDVVSERALKHVRELEILKLRSNQSARSILCFVVQRNDVVGFRTAITDPEYKMAVRKAHANGVEVFAICVKWTKSGHGYLVNDNLPLDI